MELKFLIDYYRLINLSKDRNLTCTYKLSTENDTGISVEFGYE